MKTFISLLLIVLTFNSNFEQLDKNSFENFADYQNPPKFALTEMNGRESEEKAYFTIKYDNTFQLELGDGTIFKYVPYKHFGKEPLCKHSGKRQKR